MDVLVLVARPSARDGSCFPKSYHLPIEMTPEEIVSLRRRTGLNQVQFAGALGVRQATVSYWESGRHEPRDVQLLMLEQLRARFDGEDREERSRERLAAAIKLGLAGMMFFLFRDTDTHE